LLAATGGVHAALVPMHAHEAAAAQWLFALSAVALFAVALLVDRVARPVAPAAAFVLLAGLIAAYAVTRTTVVWPFDHREELDALGVITKLLEAVGLALALVLLRTHSGGRQRLPAPIEGVRP
jgi:hypothetical protein